MKTHANETEHKQQQPQPVSNEPKALIEQGAPSIPAAQRALLDSGRAGAIDILALQRTAGDRMVQVDEYNH